jgi:uncharacterized protein YsxB (DUF464 family)
VRGHAGFAPAGRDIVCAAASALILSAANGLREHCGAKTKISDASSLYRLDLPGGGGACAQAVLATMVSGLEAIAASYPSQVTVKQAEPVTATPGARRAKSKSTGTRGRQP